MGRCIENLYESYQSDNGAHLFEYLDKYHTWEFYGVVRFLDPSADDNNRSISEAMKERLKAQIDKAKEDKQNEPGLKFISAYYSRCEGIAQVLPSNKEQNFKGFFE